MSSLLLILAVLVPPNVVLWGVLAWVAYRRCPSCNRRIRYQTPAGRADARRLHLDYDCPARARTRQEATR